MSRATCRGTRMCSVVEVVDDEPRDQLRDVPRHPDARRRRSRASADARQVVATHGMAEVEPVWP
jgi:hypothetical protein